MVRASCLTALGQYGSNTSDNKYTRTFRGLVLITDTRPTGNPALACARCNILETPLCDIPSASAIRVMRHRLRYRMSQTWRCLSVRLFSEILGDTIIVLPNYAQEYDIAES